MVIINNLNLNLSIYDSDSNGNNNDVLEKARCRRIISEKGNNDSMAIF